MQDAMPNEGTMRQAQGGAASSSQNAATLLLQEPLPPQQGTTSQPAHASECERSRRAIAQMFQRCGPLMTALGDATRQDIVVALLDAGGAGARVGQLTEATNLSRPAVSHHLKVLKDAGAVEVRKQGTMNFYYLDAASETWKALQLLANAVGTVAQRAQEAGYPGNAE